MLKFDYTPASARHSVVSEIVYITDKIYSCRENKGYFFHGQLEKRSVLIN
jgi:hypothetical protein